MEQIDFATKLMVGAAVVAMIGFAGAWAFNEDGGAVYENGTLWQIFGLAAYIGIAAVLIFIVAIAILAIVKALGRITPGRRN